MLYVQRDKILINSKIRDEYRIVKDIVQERDSKNLSLVPATLGSTDANLNSSGMLYSMHTSGE